MHLPQDFPFSLAFRLFSGSGCILFRLYLLLRFQLLAAHLGKIGLVTNLPSVFRFFLAAFSRTAIGGFVSGIAKGVLRTLALLPQLVSEIRIFLASHRLHPLYFLHFG